MSGPAEPGAGRAARAAASGSAATRAAPGSLLEVADLRVVFGSGRGERVRAVDGVSFEVQRGEVLAVVGESGSGKSVSALALLGLLRGRAVEVSGSALLDGRELIGAPESELRRVRGAQVAMVFQDPQSSLNPLMRVGEQIAEQIRAHDPAVSHARALERAAELMERMRIPAAPARVRSYPHELSGGMRQRAMIAMALSLGPKVLLADEPTTALDVTVQAEILAQLAQIRDEGQTGIVLITHDFGVVAQVADRIAVMQAGRIVEQGAAAQVLGEPRHPHTQALLRGLEPPGPRRARVEGGEAVYEVEDLRVDFGLPRGAGGDAGEEARGDAAPGAKREGRRLVRHGHETLSAVDGVSLAVHAGETLAIVGESGSGKTTLLRTLARLIEPDGGTVRFEGADVTHARRRGLAPLRGSLGMVFQDPQASLNPRVRVGRALECALRARGVPREEAPGRARSLLERVGLAPGHARRYPHELSGGERQRVAIARAVAGRPRAVLLDEPVSSLDASLRAQVLALLAELQAELGCAYVLVAHDLAMVAGVADRVAVMQAGRIVELAGARELFERPRHPYTQALLAASPRLPGDVRSLPWPPPPQGPLPESQNFSRG